MRARATPYVLGAALSLLFVAPFVVRENSWMEWANSYWLLHEQTEHIRETGLPTYFVSGTSVGIAYPIYVFYGGFTMTVLGYLASVTSVWFVFSASLVGAFFAGFVGIYWATRALGLDRLPATALAVVGISTPYFVTNLYGRGAWAELIGVGSSYLLLGASLRAMTDASASATRRSTWWTIAGASAILAGTHNISLLIGTVFVGAVLLVLAAGSAHLSTPWLRRVGVGVAVPALLGVGLCGAWLLPNLWLSNDTAIYVENLTHKPAATAAFDAPSTLLSPLLERPTSAVVDPGRDDREVRVFNQTCALLLLPIAFGVLSVWWRRKDPAATVDRRVLFVSGGIGAISVALFVLMTRPTWWGSLPEFAQAVQFPYRLNPYLTAGLVLLAGIATLTVMQPARRVLVGALVAIAAWYTVLAVFQSFTAQPLTSQGLEVASHDAIDAGELPPSFNPGFYQIVQFRLPGFARPLPTPSKQLVFELGSGRAIGGPVAPGTYASNVVWSPLVEVSDATVIGADKAALAVMRVDADASGLPEVHMRFPGPVRAGIALSFASLAAILAAAVLSVRYWPSPQSTSDDTSRSRKKTFEPTR